MLSKIQVIIIYYIIRWTILPHNKMHTVKVDFNKIRSAGTGILQLYKHHSTVQFQFTLNSLWCLQYMHLQQMFPVSNVSIQLSVSVTSSFWFKLWYNCTLFWWFIPLLNLYWNLYCVLFKYLKCWFVSFT